MRLILRISQTCSGPGRVLGRRICYEEHSRGNDPFDTFPVVTWYNFGGMAILIVYYEVLYCDKSNPQKNSASVASSRFMLVITPYSRDGKRGSKEDCVDDAEDDVLA